MKHLIKALSVGIVLALTGVARATPISGSLSFGTSLQDSEGNHPTDTETAGWTGTPTTLQQGATASADENTAYAFGTSVWAASGNSGFVDLTFGWEVFTARSINTNNAPPDWTYTFTADDSGSFQMHYSIFGEGNQQFGLNGFTISSDLIDPMDGPTTNSDDPGTFGLFSGGVIAGDSYTVSISNHGNVPSSVDEFVDVSASGAFIWTISNSVPDQGSTLIMIGAAVAALVGLQARRPKLRTE
jgi:hypothetical protein